ncbi:MAG: chemotaxis protein CheA [Prolixibacteraceae bacterium]|jgi:two-component system chemotaxis sensor kinase CheA|nr:chemotaxis protein CheA [Prolixibacteraceae bacterium]
MAESIDQLRVSFVEETRDLITELEDVLLSLETDAVSSDVVDQIFRSIHTIKGSGGMLGFEKVLEVTHDLEDIYDKVRSGEMDFTIDLKDISLETIDVLKNLLATDENLADQEKIRFVNLCKKIQLFDVSSSLEKNSISNEAVSIQPVNTITSTYFIQLVPGLNSAKELSHSKYLVTELSQMGDCLAFAKSGDSIKLNSFEKVNKNAKWAIFLSTGVGQLAIEDVFDWIKDDIGVSIKKLVDGDLLAVESAKKEFEALKDILFEKTIEDIELIANKYADQIIIEEIQPVEKEKSTAEKEKVITSNAISSIRVATDKIDQLMNLVSEMVTLQARLNLLANEIDNPELNDVSEKYGSFSKQLRDNAFTISLIPFGVSMTRYKRMVHDLSEQLNKKVDFVTEGADTVLDKKIIEQLSDPIMHILRNCIDHGIEDTEGRKKNGKEEVGKISMNVYHQSNNVIIEIVDDGKGIDLDVIKRIGIEKKLITIDQNISNSELLNLIFLPGFSSAKSVSNVSGRGVGLDVVKRNISEIRGAIDIQTEKGKGTTFIIKLPLTLSIIDGLQVRIDERDIIIPLVQVDKISTLTNEIQDTSLNQLLLIDGMQIPYFDLRKDFEIGGEIPERREIVIASYESEKVALIVDYVVGENQTVLKPLGKHFKKQDFISGGTILGDGSVALVLDINKIVTEFSKK